jgi:hypothetical protein
MISVKNIVLTKIKKKKDTLIKKNDPEKNNLKRLYFQV